MDRIDLQLLAELERDGRQSFATLADAARLSKTSCWTRVQALERDGAIRAYGIDVDPVRLGLPLTAYVQVMIDPGERPAFEKAVANLPVVLDCVTVAGDADYLLRVVAPDVLRLDGLLRDRISLLPGVQRSSTTICLKTIKGGGSLVEAAKWYDRMR